jgi:hypothetical protein
MTSKPQQQTNKNGSKKLEQQDLSNANIQLITKTASHIYAALMTSIKFPNMRINNTTDANPNGFLCKYKLYLIIHLTSRD